MVKLLVLLEAVDQEWDCQYNIIIVFSGVPNPLTLGWLNIRNGQLTLCS